MRLAKLLIACPIVAAIVPPSAAAAPPRYSVLKIGQVAAGFHPLNDLGQVSGTATAVDGVHNNAFLTQPNAPFSFPTDLIVGTENGYGVNDLGQVVGNYALGDGFSNGFRTRPGQPFDPAIDGVGSFGHGSQAQAINALGQVTGYLDQAYRLNMGETISLSKRLGTLGGETSEGLDINDLGQVVGRAQLANGFNHAFRTGPNANINPLTDDLGTLGGNNSRATAVNAAGMVAGFSEFIPGNLRQRAFRTKPHQPIDPATDDLGSLGGGRSAAVDMNDAGWVVGSSTIDPTNPNSDHAFVFDGTTMWDLNDLIVQPIGLPLRFAEGINNSGQILAEGFGSQYLLTPIPVPEPATIGLLSAAAATLAFVRFVRTRARQNHSPPRTLFAARNPR